MKTNRIRNTVTAADALATGDTRVRLKKLPEIRAKIQD